MGAAVKVKNDRAANNWALLLGVSLVSFGGALVYLMAGENSIGIPLYFIVASAALAGFAFLWFKQNPPAMRAPWWAYALVVAGLEFGAFFGGAIGDTRDVGPWVVVGIAFIFYGILERCIEISITGLLAAGVGVLGFSLALNNLGFWLEIITGLIFGAAALILRKRRYYLTS